jgi:hypothetical protein
MEALKPAEDGRVAAPKKYPDELRERAVRMVMDLRKDPLTVRDSGMSARPRQRHERPGRRNGMIGMSIGS